MLSWILRWAVVAASTGVVWEFALHRPLQLDLALARGAVVLLAFALSIIPVTLLDFFGGFAQGAWDRYAWSYARLFVGIAALLFLALVVPYTWFAVWLLKRIWPSIPPWFAELGAPALRAPAPTAPTPGEWVLVAAIAAALVGLVFRLARRKPFYAYDSALAVLGLRRWVLGICLMFYFRLLAPRRDFFLQAPVVGWMPTIAVAVFIHEFLAPSGPFAVAIPALLLMLIAPMWLGAIAPPLWIFLGTSEFDSFRTFYDLRVTWRRHGLTLLNREGEEGERFYAGWRGSVGHPGAVFYDPGIGRVWSLRTRPQMWQTAVRLLAAFVPVIVVDIRRSSDAVTFEIEWLARRGFMHKVYMIVQDESAGDEVSGPTRVGEAALMKMRWNHDRLVSEQR